MIQSLIIISDFIDPYYSYLKKKKNTSIQVTWLQFVDLLWLNWSTISSLIESMNIFNLISFTLFQKCNRYVTATSEPLILIYSWFSDSIYFCCMFIYSSILLGSTLTSSNHARAVIESNGTDPINCYIRKWSGTEERADYCTTSKMILKPFFSLISAVETDRVSHINRPENVG